MRYANDWRRIVTRLGRWIDFDNDYKTLGKVSLILRSQLHVKCVVGVQTNVR